MSITINAHQLGRLLDQTAEHIGSEYAEELHGVRLDVDSRNLYAVASDRYTLAVARYHHGGGDQEPWARTISAGHLTMLREWVGSMKGPEQVAISTQDDRLVFDGPQTSVNIAVSLSLEFPDWRGILRKIAAKAPEGELFPALDSGLLQRFGATGHILRVRAGAEQTPTLFFGEDFIGAQMPVRLTSNAPTDLESFATAYNSWHWTLAAGSKDSAMADMPAEQRSRYEVTTDVPETAAGLLRGVLRMTSNSFDAGHFAEDRDAFHAYIHAGVADWMAYRYLDALYQVDPRAARAVVADTADELESGELGEFAWDAATKAGHEPKKWQDDYEAAIQKRNAKEPSLAALRLAAGLNVAKNFGIAFDIDDNPHVRFDETESAWVAVKPEPAEAPAS
ncbi:hypothetical protein ABZ608_42400 [Streptomyces sp. NPDC013172]|uniref:DNA polymerase III beta sliding clamp central domain-containing protein n=1 Tax=Streptomyces atriruber TaxID=545121 RepID=A0ABV3C146_9ACTN